MAIIRVTCPQCGDEEVTSRDVLVRVCRDNSIGSYEYMCPQCRQLRVKSPAATRIVEILVASGCRLVTWSIPAEMRERRPDTPLEADEVLDLTSAMDQPGYFEDAFAKLIDSLGS